MTEYSAPWPGASTLGDDGPYTDDTWSEIWETLTQVNLNNDSGISRGQGSELEVIADSPVSTQIDIGTGKAFIKGRWYKNDTTVPKTISANSSGNDRIDLVVLRKDWTAQEIRISVKEGTPAATPVAPALTQTSGSTWEIPLAEVYVANGFSTIANSDITDRRRITGAASTYGARVDVTLSSGTFARTNPFHVLVSESGTADTLDTITGGKVGDIVVLQAASGHTITLTYGTGADALATVNGTNGTLYSNDMLVLINDGSKWVEPYNLTSDNLRLLEYKNVNLSNVAAGTDLAQLTNLVYVHDVVDRSTNSISEIDVPGMSISFTAAGGDVLVMLSVEAEIATAYQFYLRLYRDATLLKSVTLSSKRETVTFVYRDSPGSGTYTYKLRYYVSNAAGTAVIHGATHGPSVLVAMGGY